MWTGAPLRRRDVTFVHDEPPKSRDQDQAGRRAAITAQVGASLADLLTRRLAPGLYVVATPIGHLGDTSLRAIATLANAAVIYCEDTRHSRTLLAHFSIATPLATYHEHNANAVGPEIVARIAGGAAVALVSDAGTPLVSDPGQRLVADVIAAGLPVTAVPGASAPLAALVQSGLSTDTVTFAGFLPTKAGQRAARLAELMALAHTIIVFEAPGRVAATIAEIAARDPERRVVVARELTKLHEEIRRGPARDLDAALAGTDGRGEYVLLIGPPAARTEIDDPVIRERVQMALKVMSLKDAVAATADALGVAKKRVYDIALALKDEPRT
jgi:16S rRNA (cytidine1402-2'-O)-methyltransferase